jgi:hypothetical protein
MWHFLLKKLKFYTMKKLITLFMLILSVNFLFATSAIKDFKSGDCAQIVLKTGDVISANVLQISPCEVKYKRCGKPNDPEMVLPSSKILKIKDTDGSDIWDIKNNTCEEDRGNSNEKPLTNFFAIGAFVDGIVSLITPIPILAILLAVLGIVLGAVAIKQIRDNPKKYKGKGLAIAGLVCGIVTLVLLIALLALV